MTVQSLNVLPGIGVARSAYSGAPSFFPYYHVAKVLSTPFHTVSIFAEVGMAMLFLTTILDVVKYLGRFCLGTVTY